MNFKKNILLFILVLFPALTFAQYSGGTGTSGDPHQISTLADLTTLATNVNGGTDYNGVYFILTTNIEASSTRTINQALNGTYQGFDPIGQTGNVFDGNFNGQGNSVNNLYINRPTADNIGLFGLTGAAAVIQNLELYNAEITGQNNVGGIAGTFVGTSINDVHFDGKINGQDKTGGIAGILTGTIIKNAYSTGYVNGNSNTGGIAGEINNGAGSIQNTYNTALVNGVNTTGGLVGILTDGAVNDSYNIGAVSGNYYLGALVGNNANRTISRCYFNPQTSNTTRGIGTGTLSGANVNFETKTRTEMAAQATYTGWAFNATNWAIADGSTLPYLNFQNIVLHNTDFKTTTETSIDFTSQVLRNTGTAVTINEYGFVYSSTNPIPTVIDQTAGVTTGLSISTASNTTVTDQPLTNLFEHQRYYGRFYAKDNNNKYYYGNTLLLLPPEELKILSAKTNSARNVISIEFDKDINSSTLTASNFSVMADETAITITSAALNAVDKNIVELTLSQTLTIIPVVTVSYTAGTLAAADGGRLTSVTKFTVINSPIFNGLQTLRPATPQPNQYFGEDLASFGEYLVVGMRGESTFASNKGVVFIYKRSGQKFNKIAELTSSDGAANDFFGISVDIYQNTIAVGAYGDNSNSGSIYIFEKSGAEWTDMTEVAKLEASDAAAVDNLGYSVAISGDVVIAGAPGENGTRGAGYVFVKPQTGWNNTVNESAKLILASGSANDALGTSVAITSDYVVLGAPGNSSSQGKSYIFEKPKDGWKNAYQTAELSASDGANNNTFGYSVEAQDNIVAVGATGASASGAVYIYSKPATGWADITQIKKIIPATAVNGNAVGSSLDLTESRLAIGATSNTTSGSVFIFEKDPNDDAVWTQRNKINSGSNVSTEKLGSSVSMIGNFLASGSPGISITGGGAPDLNSGTLQIYNSNTNPTSAASTISVTENSTYTLQKSDFPFTDPDAADALYGVEIKNLPAKGTFNYSGAPVALNTVYTDPTKFTYRPVTNETASPYTTFTFKVLDSFGARSVLNYEMTINVPPVNTPPTGASNPYTIKEDEDYIFSQTSFGYADTDGHPMNSVIITAAPGNGKLYLDSNSNSIIDSGEMVTTTTEVTAANINNGTLKYKPGADSSGSPFTTFDFKVTDAQDQSTASYTITFNVTAVNDAPVISNVETGITTYIIGKDTLNVSTTLSILDVDNANLSSASIKIATGFDVDDTLTFKTQAGITGVYSNGTLSLTGSATFGEYAKAIQSVVYSNNDVVNPVSGNRIFEFIVNDGTDASLPVTRTVNVQAVQDIPVFEIIAPVIVQEGQSVIITKNNLRASNPDNTASDLTYLITKPPVFGTLSHPVSITQEDINADKFTYTNNGNEVSKDSILFRVKNKNGILTPDTVLHINVTAANDPPVFSNIPIVKAKEDSAITLPVSIWYPYVTDPDNADSTLFFTMHYTGNNIIKQEVIVESRVKEFILEFREEWSGKDSLLLKVSDGNETDSIQLVIDVQEVNDKPVFVDVPAFVAFQNDQFFKGNIWQMVEDIESADNLLKYYFTPANDSLTVSYSKTTGSFWIDALPYFGKETTVQIRVEDPDGAYSDTTLVVKVTDVFTSIADTEIPDKYELYQNYPNPFNPETVIKFDLPEDSDVKLSVYNVVGEKVETLVNREMSAGMHKIKWKASRYSSGVYFYRLDASSVATDNKYKKVEKMLLIK